MKILRKETGVWDISCDGSRDALLEMAYHLQALAHENVGNSKTIVENGEKVIKKFIINFNRSEVRFSTNVELWTFAKGLEVAAETFVAKLFDKNIVKPVDEIIAKSIIGGDVK